MLLAFRIARSEFLRFFAPPNESLRLIIIYYIFKYNLGLKTNMLESLRSQKSLLKARFRHNLLKRLSFCARWVFKACWMCKWVRKTYYDVLYILYTFIVKTTLVVLLRSQKNLQRLYFWKTSYNHIVLARGEFLRVVGARNEVLRLIILYYKFKYLFCIKTTLVESHQSQKTHLKSRFTQN